MQIVDSQTRRLRELSTDDLFRCLAIEATSDITLDLSAYASPVDGQTARVRVHASGASRNVTLGAQVRIPSSSSVTSPVLVASGTKTIFAFMWDADASKWLLISLVPGY